MIATILPYIFKTYSSLEGSINFILKYWSIYGFYILVRNIITDDKKIKIVINTLIISSIIPIIFGIDKLTFNIFENFLNLIDAFRSSETIRMVSTFGYANSFALYLTIMGSLTISQLITNKNKFIKILYIIYLITIGICIAYTQSKGVIFLIVLAGIIFFMIGIIKKKINKKILLGILFLIIGFFIYFFIAINISKPLVITEATKERMIKGLHADTEYTFTFNIDAKSNCSYDNFTIEIVEVSKSFSENVLNRVSFGNYTGEKTMSFHTNNDFGYIMVKITNKSEQSITINSLKVNGNQYIIEYKIIKDELVSMFRGFSLSNSSVWQRIDFWKDGINIIKSNWLIGAGGNVWQVEYGSIQDYLYYAKEVHSYLLEVWMSFGLIGIISYILIIVITLKSAIKLIKTKNINHNYIAIFISLLFIIIHSIIDFDMSFLIIELIFYLFIAILNNKRKTSYTKLNFIDYIIPILLVLILIGNSLGLISSFYKNTDYMESSKIAQWISKYNYNKIVYIEKKHIQDDNIIEYIKQYITNEPYQNQNIMYENICNELIKDTNTIKVEDVQILINTWSNIKVERKYDIDIIIKRENIMLNFAKELKNSNNSEIKDKSDEILEIIKNECETNKYIILDYKRNLEFESVSKTKYIDFKNIYDEACRLKSN